MQNERLKTVVDFLKQFLTPVHEEGWTLIGLATAVSAGLLFVSSTLAVVAAVVALWLAYFFRDPPRVTPLRDGLVVAPADGVVVSVAEVPLPPEMATDETPTTRIGIFLSAFDVHINRVPADGRITRIVYTPGLKAMAFGPKASADNERNHVAFDLGDGRRLVVVQIAGFLARRIRCWVAEGAAMRAGERFGMIRFGSRVDVYLPPGTASLVVEGQRCVAGETVIADLRSSETARQGIRR